MWLVKIVVMRFTNKQFKICTFDFETRKHSIKTIQIINVIQNRTEFLNNSAQFT